MYTNVSECPEKYLNLFKAYFKLKFKKKQFYKTKPNYEICRFTSYHEKSKKTPENSSYLEHSYAS